MKNRITEYLSLSELMQTPVASNATGVVAPAQAQAIAQIGVTRFNPAQLALRPRELRKLIRRELAEIKAARITMSADDPARDYLSFRVRQLRELFTWSRQVPDNEALALGVFPAVEAVAE